MNPRGGPPGRRRGSAFLLHLLLAALVRLYGALLVLYPKAFRRRYGAEMRRDFSELMREGLEEGGAKELVRVWAQALPDLVLTALKERSTMPAARTAYYVPVDPTTAARAMVRAMVAVVCVAGAVTAASLWQQPTYEAYTEVRVDQQLGNQGKVEGLQSLMLTMTHAIDSRLMAEEAIGRLGLEMTSGELLDNLAVEHVEGTYFIGLTYEGTNLAEATYIVNTMANVSSDRISDTTMPAGSDSTASVYEKAIVPDNPTPVSPHPLRNGLLTLVTGLVLCAGLVVALPGVAASVAGKPGGRTVRQGVGQAGLPGGRHGGPSDADVLKEKELLQALGRCGKLTAVEAAMETSLTVEEAERMLQALAAKGHLEVTVEHGRLHYAL
jgi:capsular polysaccharide biosynthesis protein